MKFREMNKYIKSLILGVLFLFTSCSEEKLNLYQTLQRDCQFEFVDTCYIDVRVIYKDIKFKSCKIEEVSKTEKDSLNNQIYRMYYDISFIDDGMVIAKDSVPKDSLEFKIDKDTIFESPYFKVVLNSRKPRHYTLINY